MRGIAIAVLSFSLALFSGQQAALAYWRGLGPTEVPGMFASDPLLQVAASDYRFIENSQQLRDDAARHSQIARAAIAMSPFNAVAMRQLGMLADLKRPNEGGWPYFEAAEGITPRDLPNQVILINQTIGQGDVAAILAHYDRALRVYSSAGQGLFPPLIRASAEQSVRDQLSRFAKSPWFPALLGQMINVGEDPARLMDFLLQVRPQLTAKTADQFGSQLLGQLVSKGRYADARNWIFRSQPSLAKDVDDLGFSQQTIDPRLAPLAWSFASREGVEVARTEAGTLEIEVGAGRHETVAERTTLLPPGRYDLTQVLSHEPGKPAARLSWELRCLSGGSEAPIWQFEQPAGSGQQRFNGQFVIPEECRGQHWKLSARSDSTQFESSSWIVALSASRRLSA